MSQATHIAVIDPDGNLHEVTRRNANDLVTHLGWRYSTAGSFVVDKNAQAPREVKSRENRIKELEEKFVENESTAKKQKENGASSTKKAKKKGTALKHDDVDLIAESEDVIPVDFQEEANFDEEIAAIDADTAGKD
jgi:hypothetical protein